MLQAAVPIYSIKTLATSFFLSAKSAAGLETTTRERLEEILGIICQQLEMSKKDYLKLIYDEIRFSCYSWSREYIDPKFGVRNSGLFNMLLEQDFVTLESTFSRSFGTQNQDFDARAFVQLVSGEDKSVEKHFLRKAIENYEPPRVVSWQENANGTNNINLAPMRVLVADLDFAEFLKEIGHAFMRGRPEVLNVMLEVGKTMERFKEEMDFGNQAARYKFFKFFESLEVGIGFSQERVTPVFYWQKRGVLTRHRVMLRWNIIPAVWSNELDHLLDRSGRLD